MASGTETKWVCPKCRARQYDHAGTPRPLRVAHRCLSNRGKLTTFKLVTR